MLSKELHDYEVVGAMENEVLQQVLGLACH